MDQLNELINTSPFPRSKSPSTPTSNTLPVSVYLHSPLRSLPTSFESQSMIDSAFPTPLLFDPEPSITLGVENDINTNTTQFGDPDLNYSYDFQDAYPTSGVGFDQGRGEGYLVDQYRFLSGFLSGSELVSSLVNYPGDPTSTPLPLYNDQYSTTSSHSLGITSPLQQFPQAKYALPDSSYPPTEPQPAFDTLTRTISNFPLELQPQFATYPSVPTFRNGIDPRSPSGIEIDQLALSPTGLWTPITLSSSLPFLPLSSNSHHNHDFGHGDQFSTSQPLHQVQPEYQGQTPTLAPYYPRSDLGLELGLDLDLDFSSEQEQNKEQELLEMTRDLLPFYRGGGAQQSYIERTITPIDTIDHRPSVSCRPTMQFPLPSALGSEVHNLETFGLKAIPTPDHVSGFGIDSSHGHHRMSQQSLVPGIGDRNGFENSNLPPPKLGDVGRKGGLFDMLLSKHQDEEGGGPYDLLAQGYGNGSNGHSIDSISNDHHSQYNNRTRHGQGRGGGLDRILSTNTNTAIGKSHDHINRDIYEDHNIAPYPQPHPPARQRPPRSDPRTYNHFTTAPTQTPTSSLAPTHAQAESLLALSLSQPPPHTYHPTLNINTTTDTSIGYRNGMLPTPMTTSSGSSLYHSLPGTTHYDNQGHDNKHGMKLTGVNHLFDDLDVPRYPAPPSFTHGHATVQHTHSAPPSTIFPNAPYWSRSISRDDNRKNPPTHQQTLALAHPQILHPPPQIFNDRVSSSSSTYHVRLSESPTSTTSLEDHILDTEMDISRETSVSISVISLESEEGANEEDEVLSEYKPNRPKKHLVAKGKGKGEMKSKSSGKGGGKGKGKGGSRGRPILQPQPPIQIAPLPPQAQIQAQGSIQTGPSDSCGKGPHVPSGYMLIMKDGIAYTEDAELKQTAEVRRICYNCHTKTPPSWRKSVLVPGKILCNKCGIYERTHHRPRPQQQDDMKLRRNPTPPPSVGGYEPLVYPVSEEGNVGDSGLSDRFSPVSQTSAGVVMTETTQSQPHSQAQAQVDFGHDGIHPESGIVYPNSILEVGAINGVEPLDDSCFAERGSINIATATSISRCIPVDMPVSTSISLPPPIQLESRQEGISTDLPSQAELDNPVPIPSMNLGLDRNFDPEPSQLPPLKSVSSFWQPNLSNKTNPNSNSNTSSAQSSNPVSRITSPIHPLRDSQGQGQAIGHGLPNADVTAHGVRNMGRRISMTPYSRPLSDHGLGHGRPLGNKGSSVSLRGVDLERDSGQW